MSKNRLITAALLSAALVAQTVWALESPQRSKADHRIQYVDYNADDVTRVNAANGYITTIIFAPGEEVTNYGSGYSTAWEFATADNKFFLKPKDKEGTTNLVIVTNKRVYNLDVHLVAKPSNATYKLTFRYPQDYIDAQIKAGQEAYVQEQLKKRDPDLDGDKKAFNYNYSMNFGMSKSSKNLAPVEAFDNGRFTYLRFKPNADFPAVYSVNSDGEAIINSHVEDGYLVIHGVYPEYRLRAGQDVVGLYNEGYNGGGHTPSSGTTVQGLVRDIKD